MSINSNDTLNPILFKIVDGDVILCRDELGAIPIFRKIIQRDKGSNGDADGRKKFRAYKEFSLVYEIGDPNSYSNKAGFSDKESIEYCKRVFGLPNDFKIDTDLKAAIDFYKNFKEEEIPSIKLLNELIKSLRNNAKIVERLNKSIESSLEDLDNLENLSIGLSNTDGEQKGQSKISIITSITDLQTKIFNIATKTPEILENIERIAKKVKTEEANKTTIAGGKTKARRADPR